MRFPALLLAVVLTLPLGLAGHAQPVAMNAINALGIDLLRQTAPPNANALLSPYSIQMAMAMAYAGADGQTREEMARVLHFPADEAEVNDSFATLQGDLAAMMGRQATNAQYLRRYGLTNDPLTLTTANRLFGQTDYDFRPTYLSLLKDTYLAPLETWDFIHDSAGATGHINQWVEEQTHDRIQNLIPAGALTRDTRLVLVNAIYMKAPWAHKFEERDTRPRPFTLAGGKPAPVPTMFLKHDLGYVHRDGFTAVALPYLGDELQLLILLPDATDGLAALEAGLKPETLAKCASLPGREVELYLPKFKLEPPAMSLSRALQSLGMKSAFDLPHGSANFDRMAPRRPDDYLYISDIFHKTFLKLDEQGTEAAAATAVLMMKALLMHEPPPRPIQIHVDHPFLFAIQHRASGACLFLGHVTDPR
jgi:serpin B